MKYEKLIDDIGRVSLIGSAIVIIVLLFAGCAADGSFDYKAFDSITRTGFEAYDRYHGYSPRGEMPVAYPVYPTPVYPVYR